MLSLGIDIGTSTVKLVLLKNQEIEKQWMAVHHGNPFVCLKKGLSTLELAMDTPFSLCVTGSNTEALLEQDSAIPSLGDIPAIVEGVRWIIPQVGSVIEIGSQGARFITDLQSRAPQFSVNEHCAGGTGSFFEEQMSRVGCRLGDYSSLVEQAQSVPRLSGRCAVFAKTDIIHRQQEGVSTPDILLGLCYAMIRNYKVTIVRRLPICKPVVFCGGVTCNAGVIRAIRDVFGLSEKELIVPEFARYEAALGAALKASGSFTLRQLNDSLDRTLTTHHMVGTLPKLELRPGTSLAEPNATKIIPESGCALGIDIGSTSTDLVLVGADGELVDFQYLRTAGDPEGAVRKGLASIRQRFGDIRFTAVGVTGSGRERVGKRIGADAVRDEITAQAKGAAHWVPEVDTVFEIGGQDSKYISIQNGEVVDFQMNKICAAGTGSFVEEQAARMGIPLAEFGPLALSSEHPAYNNLYYPFGQHILSGAKLIAHHPNLYAVYLTNHGCGPDTMLSHLFKQEMGDKPYLQIEVDEHFSNVGVITRIEAFLNSLQHRPAVALPTDFNIEQVDMSDVQIGDAALFIRNELLQFGGLACLDDVVHGKILLFQNDFGIDRSTVGFCAAQCFRRYIQHFSGFDRHFLPIDSQKKLAVSLTTQIKSGAVIVFRGNRSACAQGKPCYRHSIAQSGRSGNGHSIPDRANLGKCKRDIVHTAVSSRRATGTMLRTDRP